MGWLTSIFGILSSLTGLGETVKSISSDIANLQVAKLEAGTEERKAEINAELEALRARRDVLIAESARGSAVNMWFRVFISLPAGIILWKIEVWDRTLDWGSTPRLSTEEWAYISVVTGFYLLNRVIQIVKR